MTDLYIRREEPSKRPIIIAVVLIALITVGIIVYNLRGRGTESEGVQESLSEQVEPSTPLVEPKASAGKPAPRKVDVPKKTSPTTPSKSLTGAQYTERADLLTQARNFQSSGNLLEARRVGLQILAGASDDEWATQAEELLGTIHIAMAFSPHAMPEKEEYTVQPGDSLDRISKKFGTTIDLVQKGNNVTGSLIHVGDRFRILRGDFSIEVDKSDNDLVLSLNNTFFKRYRVGTGEFGKTPVGSFKITDKIKHPPWWRPDGKQIPYGDPDNLLGTHWLSLDIRGYGIHGTWEPDTIGKQASAGCIRLINEEVEELFALVPLGTPVIIND